MKWLTFPLIITACMMVLVYTCGNEEFKENIVTIKVGKLPSAIEVADLNGDKMPDLIIANGGDSSVTILLGRGKGKFVEAAGSPFYAGCEPNDIAIADFNKDSKPDLAFANHTKKYLTVLIGDGTGKFRPIKGSPFPVNVVPHTHGIVAADFNHDGNIDLLTDSWGNDHLEILFGNNAHGFDTPGVMIPVGKHPYQKARVGDFNRDGNVDIVTTNLDGNNCTILLGNGKGGFHESPGSPFPCGDSPFGVAIGDINSDGIPDLAIVDAPSVTSENTGRDGLTILTGDGRGGFVIMPGSPFTTGKGPTRLAIGDLNGDGILDIAVANYKSNTVTVFLMSKKAVASQYTITVGNKPDGIVISDVDGDGHNEILVTNSLDNTVDIIKTPK